MDKNNIIGFCLIAIVLIGFTWYSQPSADDIAAARMQDSIAAVQKAKADKDAKIARIQAKAKAEAAEAADTAALFHAAKTGATKDIVLKNNKLRLTFSTKGAALTRAELLGYKAQDGRDAITLFDKGDHTLRFLLAGKTDNIISDELYFTPTAVSDTTVTFTAAAANGGQIQLSYTLSKDYLLRMSLQTKRLAGMFAPTCNSMDIEWTDMCRQQEKGFNFENRYATLTYKDCEEGTDHLSETSDKTDEKMENALDWIAFKNQFFSAVLISKDTFQPGALLTSKPQEQGSGYLKYYKAKATTTFDPKGTTPSEFEMYLGPNDFQTLQSVETESRFGKELELQQLVYLGWPLFRIINRWFTIYVFSWLTSLGLNMGIVLILITLLLKAITYPMVKKTYMNSAKMRVLKPKLDAATAQFNKPEDQMQKQQAMMSLYSKYGVSPLSGCVPMLIQMPIWIAMFNFVPNAIQLRGQSFLWIDDLSTYDPIIEWGTNIWLIGDHLSLTCILFCVANILYTLMTMRQQKDQMVGQQAEQMKMMQWMMYLMPLMFFFMFNDYSAGLNFYYFISLFFSAAIMWLLRKTTNDAKLLQILEARYKENEANPKKASGLAARLEAMQKQAAELEKKNRERRR